MFQPFLYRSSADTEVSSTTYDALVYLSDMFSSEKSPLKYFMDDMLSGNSLRNTTTAGNEKERERVYDTIFRLPWRCELVKFNCFVDLQLFI